MMFNHDTNPHFVGGLSLAIEDRWIDGIMDEIHDWDPGSGNQLPILESLNFYAWSNPRPLSTFK
jgi:hypothetical protein